MHLITIILRLIKQFTAATAIVTAVDLSARREQKLDCCAEVCENLKGSVRVPSGLTATDSHSFIRVSY